MSDQEQQPLMEVCWCDKARQQLAVLRKMLEKSQEVMALHCKHPGLATELVDVTDLEIDCQMCGNTRFRLTAAGELLMDTMHALAKRRKEEQRTEDETPY